MFWIYIAIGIIMTALLHILLRFWSDAPPNRKRRWRNLFTYGGLIAAIMVMLRLGFIKLASLYSLIMVIAPFLDRLRKPQAQQDTHRNHKRRKHPPAKSPMTRLEASKILGIDENASKEEVTAAHRKLMQRIHPDTGGSEYLASQINQARDILLGK